MPEKRQVSDSELHMCHALHYALTIGEYLFLSIQHLFFFFVSSSLSNYRLTSSIAIVHSVLFVSWDVQTTLCNTPATA